MSRPKVLITGSSGFIGSALYGRLKSDFQVTGLSRGKTADLKYDLLNENLVLPDFDFIIHAAGLAHVMVNDTTGMYQGNVTATKNLLQALNPSGIKGFVFCSTVAVYGKQWGLNIDESVDPQPTDAYGKSKLEAEQLIVEWCTTHGIPCLILRLPLVVAPNAPGNIGRLTDSLRRGRFFLVQRNQSKRSMVLLDDLVEFIHLQTKNGFRTSGIYNLTDGNGVGFNDFVFSVCSDKGFKRPIMIPLCLAKVMAFLGSLMGGRVFSLAILDKMTRTLTFTSQKAYRELQWTPNAVISTLTLVK